MKKKIWVVSELYYPEETSTGYFLTQIAEGLSSHHSVNVLCGQPSYSARGIRAPFREIYHEVSIWRCPATTLNKDLFLFRLLNMLTISLSIFIHACVLFRKNDIILVTTNPPTLPFLASLACQIRRGKCILLVHDVYPDILIAAGLLKETSVTTHILYKLTRYLYSRMKYISVLGRDMEVLIKKKLKGGNPRIKIIRNWADVDTITPYAHEKNTLLEESVYHQKFIVQYAGNMGPVHGIENLLEAAKRVSLKDSNIHFLFIGSGAKKGWLEDSVKENNLNNITFLPMQPRSDQQTFLNACDVAIIAFVPGMLGVSVPSRMYNILASGKPIIAAIDPLSEVALVIQEEKIGWVVPPNDPEKLVEVLLEARSDSGALLEMGKRARTVAENKYTLKQALDSWHSLILKIDDAESN